MCTGVQDYFFRTILGVLVAPVAKIDDLKNLWLPKLHIVSYICNKHHSAQHEETKTWNKR